MSVSSTWRTTAAADEFADHDYPDFAQEFLRRNADYRDDYVQLRRDLTAGTITNAQASDAVDKWGLVFRLRS